MAFADEELNRRYPTLADYSSPLKAAERDIVGRSKEIAQMMAAMQRPELSNVLLLAPPGAGKSLANGTLIAVDDERGYVPIEQLVVGDRVFEGPTGEPTEVTGVFPQGLRRSYRLTTRLGRSVVCNDEHLWGVRDLSDPEAGLQVVTLRQMIDGMDASVEAVSGELDPVWPSRWWLPAPGMVQPADGLDQGQVWPQLVSQLSSYKRGVERWGGRWDPVESIEDLGVEVEMTCIKVAAESELFQAGEDHIVTHNTSLVQAAMLRDSERAYMEVDLARMVANLPNTEQMASRLKELFDEAEDYSKSEGHELVLFIDEFHQVVQLSAAAVEALKPVLAASGARGLRVIAATTFEEYQQHIASNLPLVERLQEIRLEPPDQKVTVQILRGMADRYDVGDQFHDDRLFKQIYEYTERYIPASTQPRKSIRVLDAMVGWHRLKGLDMDKALLADVLLESTGINVTFRINAGKIQEQLDSKVISQKLATTTVSRRLQLCVADLHDKEKPISSFLMLGSSGVGKTELVKQLANLLFGDAKSHLIRFDMSEYANDDTLDYFRQQLTRRVSDQGHAVILFDEIEKASGKIVRILLQVLDDGRLTSEHGRQVSFLNTYIVLTTNAGSEIFETIAQYNVDDEGSGEQLIERMAEIRRSLIKTQTENKFPPELLGRIDQIVPFQPLSRSTQSQIVRNKLGEMRREVMSKHGVRLQIDERVLEYLIENKTSTESNAGGARVAIAKMTEEVTTEVATFINANPQEKVIRVDIVGTMRSEDKEMLKSDAHVVVSAAR